MATELTADLICETWRPDDVRLSPDGSRVAWSAAPYGQAGEHGESAVWVSSVDGAVPARRWTYGGSDTRPRWSPDGRRLAFLSDRDERGTNGLYVISVEGGEAEALAVRKRSVGAFAWSPDGTRIAFVAPDEPDDEDKRREDELDDPAVHGERRELGRLHVLELADGQVETLVSDERHVVDVVWSPDGSTLAVVTQDDPDLDEALRRSIWRLPASGGEPRRLCTAPGLDGLAWTSDGQRLVYVSSHEPVPQSSSTLWAVDAQVGEAAPRCIGPRPDQRACVSGMAATDHGRVAMIVLEGLGSRVELADPSTGEREPFWTAGGDVLSLDARGGQIAVAMHAASGPLEVWAGPAAALRQVSDHHAGWAAVEFGPVEDFGFTATDGLALDGIVIRPPHHSSDRPNATVVLVHGGPYSRSGRELHCRALDWGQWLATAGYTVLMPNYRGGAGHGDAVARAVRGDVGGAEWGDVLAAVDAAVDRGIADPDRLGIGGWSQGGFLTAWAVTQCDRFKAGVMGAGVSDWGAMAAQSDMPTFEAVLGGDTPWDGPGPHRGAERSPISYARQCRTPLLILHGKEDARVPVSQATAFHRALRSRPEPTPVELVLYPREPHGISELRHQVDLLRRVRAFFGLYLPVEPGTGAGAQDALTRAGS
ncbi:MAG TPA: S9 family peptidase [Nocardioides sp.]|nr:S9 family peptidase [Nocardioides sp.]